MLNMNILPKFREVLRNFSEVARYGSCPQTKLSINISSDTWLKPPLYADSEYIYLDYFSRPIGSKIIRKKQIKSSHFCQILIYYRQDVA